MARFRGRREAASHTSPEVRRRRREKLRREANRWLLPALLLLLVGLASAVFAGAWAWENHALDTQGEDGTAQALWFLADDQYVWYEQDGRWRADPALSDGVHAHGTPVTVEVVPGPDPLVAIDGARHPAGAAAVVAAASLALGTAFFLLHLRVSRDQRELPGRRGVTDLALDAFISDRGMVFCFIALITFGVLVPIAVVDPVPVDNPRLATATVLDVWPCDKRGCQHQDGEISYAVRGAEYVREVENVVSGVGEEVEVLYSHDDPADVVTVEEADGYDAWFTTLVLLTVLLVGLAFHGVVTQPLRVLWRRRPQRS
ncbi:hypothetical protein KIK06_03400 [Nocardiopsis sp. EMB25]|uniref:hypothetical protein n=1 Tax=Nocardiopsis sp. EMB25 TaxID=2835867 RepID=UPI00228488C6|nr:hypothetical protein [Nocardiopsis sp. EMB25]MCY9782935.1 hypothetical protein [Nocardiopsis sp. EMB25]